MIKYWSKPEIVKFAKKITMFKEGWSCKDPKSIKWNNSDYEGNFDAL